MDDIQVSNAEAVSDLMASWADIGLCNLAIDVGDLSDAEKQEIQKRIDVNNHIIVRITDILLERKKKQLFKVSKV